MATPFGDAEGGEPAIEKEKVIMEPVLFADDPQFWYKTQRVLGHTAYGGADTGEVLATAQRITAGDYDSWNKEWVAIADRLAVEAEQSLKKGHSTSARDGLMRASSYYRIPFLAKFLTTRLETNW